MPKTILITGSSDGIGLETAKMLVSQGHHILLHGRTPSKLKDTTKMLSADGGSVESYVADLSVMVNVETLAQEIAEQHTQLDVLINNAGVYVASDPVTPDGLDIRFAVNAIAP
ncbi:MAG: SDR family NAD(P)-dependent oxidoreductase [Cyanobacteria bacterium P01_H01_bin.21]